MTHLQKTGTGFLVRVFGTEISGACVIGIRCVSLPPVTGREIVSHNDVHLHCNDVHLHCTCALNMAHSHHQTLISCDL